MKRIICLAISILLVVALFSGCEKNKDNNASGNFVDVEYYAKLGQMPECEFSLGADVKEVDDSAKAFYDKNEESVYDFVEGQNSILIDAGTFMYYYEKEKAANGVSLIVNNNTAYGFEAGTVDIELIEALSDYEYEEITDIGDELFFMKSFENVSGIKYTFGDNAVIFAFTNNALTATAIYSLENWTL